MSRYLLYCLYCILLPQTFDAGDTNKFASQKIDGKNLNAVSKIPTVRPTVLPTASPTDFTLNSTIQLLGQFVMTAQEISPSGFSLLIDAKKSLRRRVSFPLKYTSRVMTVQSPSAEERGNQLRRP